MVEGQGFRDELKNFEKKNAIIIGMSADSVQRQKNFSEKQGFQFQLLSDESKDVLKAYEAWGKKKLYGREYEGIFRFTYVIDESGKISYAYPKVKVKTHAQDILAEL
jgi:peroxiredoxin Q/BCP|tara:strand:+ start:74 stop:394 length:321 start_codon:yes stop_codon:yes gene_type:complete